MSMLDWRAGAGRDEQGKFGRCNSKGQCESPSLEGAGVATGQARHLDAGASLVMARGFGTIGHVASVEVVG